MLILVEYFGRILLGSLLCSWTTTALPRARDFTLFAGAVGLGLVPGIAILIFSWFDPSYQVDWIKTFLWLPLGVVVFTFVIESIKKEIEKTPKQTA